MDLAAGLAMEMRDVSATILSATGAALESRLTALEVLP